MKMDNPSFEIVTDSCASLPEDIIDEYGLHILSLTYVCGEEEYPAYVKGKQSNLDDFYEKMKAGVRVNSACVSSYTARECLLPLLQAGKDVLCLSFTSALSGSYHAVELAAKELREQFPQRKIYTVDTLTGCMGQGLLVTLAARKRDEGVDIDAVRAFAVETGPQISHWFVVDDLRYLHRSGRVSKTKVLLGEMLRLKPVLHMDDFGNLVPMGVARGMKKALDYMLDKMQATYQNFHQLVYIAHAQGQERAQELAGRIKERFDVENVRIHHVDAAVGSHVGPGTVALFFLGNKR